MKKILLTLIVLAGIPSSGFSQKTVIDTVRYRFSYAIKGTREEEAKSPYDDELSVDIGDSVTYCYSRWEADDEELWDRVHASGGNANDYLAQSGPFSLYQEHDIKHFPSRNKESVITFMNKYFIYEEEMPKFKWDLVAGDTLILGYKCKKATCTHRGRTWNAWYTFSIPISEGPWKLQGLPGMILYAIDSKNQFSFECIGIKANMNTPMAVNLKRNVKSTNLKVQALRKLESSNPDAYDKAVGIKGIIYGTKPKPATACLKEYY